MKTSTQVFNTKAAFTLAEVLITLGIIGIVAAITLPTLIQKHQEKTTVVALKSFYSIISQAFQMAVTENGTPENWNLKASSSSIFITMIEPEIKILKFCKMNEKCHPADTIYMKNKTKRADHLFNPTISQRSSAQLANGMIIGTYIQNPSCSGIYGEETPVQNVCGEYMVDINGGKAPNIYGRDIFLFFITKYGIYPTGLQGFKKLYDFEEGCLSSTAQGWGCTAWVLYNENLDYLHCDDLSWTGKRKCK